MNIPKINRANVTKILTNLQNTGAKAWECAKATASVADEFVKSNKKAQIWIGITVGATALTLAGLCIKGIVNKVKEVKNKD